MHIQNEGLRQRVARYFSDRYFFYIRYSKPWDGPATGATGHQLAVVAYRDGQLYCVCKTSAGRRRERRRRKKEGR